MNTRNDIPKDMILLNRAVVGEEGAFQSLYNVLKSNFVKNCGTIMLSLEVHEYKV